MMLAQTCPIHLRSSQTERKEVRFLRSKWGRTAHSAGIFEIYRGGHPQPPDILLVLEIAEASLRYDREVKAALYARAGIVE